MSNGFFGEDLRDNTSARNMFDFSRPPHPLAPSVECVNCGTGLRNYRPYKPPTNADRIRGMSDEELAEFIKHLDSGLDEICDIQDISQDGNGCDRHENCYACYLDWLKQPAKEEHHETD